MGSENSFEAVVSRRRRLFFAIGVLLAGFSVGLGAMGTHGLEQYLPTRFDDAPRRLKAWDNGVFWQAFHALAIMIVSMSPMFRLRTTRLAAAFFLIGVLLFSGFIYVWVVTGISWLVAVVPVGGTAMLVGWSVLLWASLVHRDEKLS